MKAVLVLVAAGLIAGGLSIFGCSDDSDDGPDAHPGVGSWILDGSLWTVDPDDDEVLIIEEASAGHVYRWDFDGINYRNGTMAFIDTYEPKRLSIEILAGDGAGETYFIPEPEEDMLVFARQ